jgi:predicted alpha/beta hydrolase family esterase
MYQARGQDIRRFIRQTIEKVEGPVVVIEHSLGGIAAVDLFIEAPVTRPTVKLLVTIGSQAPLLYELNALVSMTFDAHGRLPQHFPSWLNIYDEHDFLSYKASSIFSEAQDVCVRNGQPFPESHSAYWGNAEVWDAILSKLP